MRKGLAVVTLALLVSAASHTAQAHPGNTDSSGGHTCRTNCTERWGLDYGEYHYHNGGSSSSSSGSSSNTTRTTTPAKPAGPTPEQIAQQDRTKGDSDGYAAGLQSGYVAAAKTTASSGSDAYKQGYQAGYERGYTEGTNKLNADKETAKKAGYDLGLKQDNLDIPATYKANATIQQSFTEGFNQGVQERDEKAKQEFYALGYQNGKGDNDGNTPTGKEAYLTSYKEGFDKGQSELKAEYVKQGYDAAFTMSTYKKPTNLAKAKYVDWYKEGFESNTEITTIKETAYELGLQGQPLEVPAEYQNAKVIFEEQYALGKAEYEKRSEDTEEAGTVLGGLGVAGWLFRRFYVARKMIS